MNCNQTFDILTRGPFPLGNDRDDSAVEEHLTACHECRQLAEALRPAVGLFHEAITGAESLSLPGYRGVLHTAETGTVQTLYESESVSARPGIVRKEKARRKSAAIAWAFAATCLIGFVLGIFSESVQNSVTGTTRTAARTSESRGIQHHSPGRRGTQLLASLNLPAACHDAGADTSGAVNRCCTHCHAAAIAAAAPVVPVSTLSRSCVACHSSTERTDVSWTLPQLRRYGRLAT